MLAELCPTTLPHPSHAGLSLPGCCMATRSRTSPRVSLGDFSPCSCCKAQVAGWDALRGHREVGLRSPVPMVQWRGSSASCHSLPVRLLNANKINCVRADAFQDLQNLSLLSLYDNKIQSLAKGTFTSLRAIQTL